MHAEARMLLLLEPFAELAIGRATHQASKRRKKDRVLSRRVWAVHSRKAAQQFGELRRRAARSELDDVVGDFATPLMLLAQRRNERHFPLCRFEARED
ncbi:MAG TPA: hypothetical protein VHZ95_18025, partial [Polyangiales bacterium]|nr:hypothetical protein [Polyangiales bacterium]